MQLAQLIFLALFMGSTSVFVAETMLATPDDNLQHLATCCACGIFGFACMCGILLVEMWESHRTNQSLLLYVLASGGHNTCDAPPMGPVQ